MNIRTALCTRRSIRRFEDRPVSGEILAELLEVVRYYPSPTNIQPLSFMLVTEREHCNHLSSMLKWAGCIPNYTIQQEHFPTAYIVVLGDYTRSNCFQFSAGAAVNQLLLAACHYGLGSCCLGFPNPAMACKELEIDIRRYEPLCAVALGYPAQTSTCIDLTDTCRYTINQDGNFLVPKRTVKEITVHSSNNTKEKLQ